MRTKCKNRHDKNKTPSRIYKSYLTAGGTLLPFDTGRKKAFLLSGAHSSQKAGIQKLEYKKILAYDILPDSLEWQIVV